MPAALYFPFSRCLDLTALKQAVLVYDELLFVDPVDPVARSQLYLREGEAAGIERSIARRWHAAEPAYDLLSQAGLIKTVSSEVLRDPHAADAIAVSNVAVDVQCNRVGRFFQGRHRWHMLGDRLPDALRNGEFDVRPARRWGPLDIFEVPYSVAASVTTTYAVAIAHEQGAIPLTDSEGAHRLLLMRLEAAAAAQGSLPGLHASPSSSYVNRQVEMRLVDELAPAAALRDMDFPALLDYRAKTASARRDLRALIDKFTAKIRGQPWDPQLDAELEHLAKMAREIAALPSRWGAASAPARSHLTAGSLASKTVELGAPATVVAAVTAHVPLLGALAIGAAAAGSGAFTALAAGLQALAAKRTPEQNAVSYLLNARAP